jgi:hypothetical protein
MSERGDSVNSRLDAMENKLDRVLTISGKNASTCEVCVGEISLLELWEEVWAKKIVILSFVSLALFMSLAYVVLTPSIYKSEALLAPVDEAGGRGVSGLVGQFSGLANIAGVNLSQGGADKAILALELLRSREFIGSFIQRRGILPQLMVAKSWDPEKNELVFDSNEYSAREKRWVGGATSKPSMQDAFERFLSILTIARDADTGFVKIGVKHVSPIVAKQWVDWLVQDLNLAMKNRDVVEAKDSIEYLSAQITKTSISEMKSVFYELIEEQSKIVMFAEIRQEYVFETLDRAIVPERASSPRKIFSVIVGCFLGGLLSIMLVIIQYLVKR